MKIKFCGFTNQEDLQCAEELGADFVGVILVEQSPRHVSSERAKELIAGVSKAKTVLVCASNDMSTIQEMYDFCQPDYVQLHNYPDLMLVRQLDIPLIQAFKGVPDTAVLQSFLDEVEYVLIDKEEGQSYADFQRLALLPPEILARVFVAGGVDKDNIATIKPFFPFAIDLARSIERAPGKKDHALMREILHIIQS